MLIHRYLPKRYVGNKVIKTPVDNDGDMTAKRTYIIIFSKNINNFYPRTRRVGIKTHIVYEFSRAYQHTRKTPRGPKYIETLYRRNIFRNNNIHAGCMEKPTMKGF